ncbi:hypothetical protein [Ciceribacter sp. L1K22]|uniref:hypothetical protein n=1 Tax=Ciceribacter sp. L1K22 TaxID=2820275 RepID=UPI001ABE6FF2|nr:hypothetical protein [Ciceribacter sp. L1K22]MBO3762242.1 hypothetical protein [Ciceribacter sp. L1K22]
MDSDTAVQWELVNTPVGEEWSGRARYAAAMFFHKRGEMDAATLEIYRYLARLDFEDPLAALKRYKIGDDWIARVQAGRSTR